MITYDDFSKLELKVGTILEALEVEGSEKLLKLKVDLGNDDLRQILAGIKSNYKIEDLIGKQIVVVANLETKMIMGLESQGMLLAASGEIGPVILSPLEKVNPGSKIR